MPKSSTPLPRDPKYTSKPQQNRAEQIRRDNDRQKNVTVSLLDHDSAIMYYFNEVIKPVVVENGNQVKVPVMYANPERWASVKKTGFLRDRNKQLMTPLIAFKRVSVEKDSNYAIDKLDANKPINKYTFEKRYSPVDRYDSLTANNGRATGKEFYSVSVPDYVIMNYEAVIWTSYTDQMNHIIEKINYSDGSYWGEPGKSKFRVGIDSFTDASELDAGERLVRTNFNFTFNGYLLPEFFNSANLTERGFSPKYVSIMTENYINLDAGDSQQEREFLTTPLVEKKSTLGNLKMYLGHRAGEFNMMRQVPRDRPVVNTREISTEE